MAKKKKGKKEVDINLISPDEHLRETVALQILGRTLASYAAVLTNDEKAHSDILYQLLRADRRPSEDVPETVQSGRTEDKKVNKYSPTGAIDEFVKKYPRESQPLIALRNEKHLDSKPTLTYGLQNGYMPDREYMIGLLQTKLSLRRGPARQLYEKVIEPQFLRQREESGLVTITMKD